MAGISEEAAECAAECTVEYTAECADGFICEEVRIPEEQDACITAVENMQASPITEYKDERAKYVVEGAHWASMDPLK